MGFSGIAPSLGVSFDIWNPVGDHVALITDGKLGTGKLTAPIEVNFNLEDGTFHVVIFDWISDTQMIRISLNGTAIVSHSPVKLTSLLGDVDLAFLGFTSSTDEHTKRH